MIILAYRPKVDPYFKEASIVATIGAGRSCGGAKEAVMKISFAEKGARSRVPGAIRLAVVALSMIVVGAVSSDESKLGVGKKCTGDDQCASGICGAWDPGTKGCLPAKDSVEPNGLCSNNNQCRGGASCVDHRCEVALGLGDPCTDNDSCASHYCDTGLGSGETKKCVPPAGTGKTGDYCSQEAHCKTRLCIATQCEATREPGGECRYNESCKSGHCETESFTGSGALNQGINQAFDRWFKCIPKAASGTAGQYCSNSNQCKSNYCSSANECAPFAETGQPCPGGDAHCTSGFCDAGTGTTNTRKCVPAVGKGKTGDYCTKKQHCSSNLCTDRQCEGLRELGASCPRGNPQCKSGFCDAGGGSGNTNRCVPPSGTGKTGDYCSQNGHCKPGKSCTANKCR